MALTELRIASRRSQLAMVQPNWAKAELEQAHDRVRAQVKTRFAGFRRAFRMLDFDNSGRRPPILCRPELADL